MTETPKGRDERPFQLPERFIRFLDAHKSGLVEDPMDVGALQRMELSMRLLCAACVEAGVEPVLSGETVALLEAAGRDAGRSKATISSHVLALKPYAFETGEGLDWATKPNDTRAITQIVRWPWWDTWRGRLGSLPESAHRRQKIVLADEWLRRSAEDGCNVVVMKACIAGSRQRAKLLGHALACLAPGSPDLAVFEQVKQELWPPRRRKLTDEEKRHQRRKKRAARLGDSTSVPKAFREAGRELFDPGVLKESYQHMIVSTLDGFFRFAADAGLPKDFCEKTIVAYLDRLDGSEETAGTRYIRVRILETLASEMGYPFEIVDGFEAQLYASKIG